MGLRITEEDRKELKDEFLFHNDKAIQEYTNIILKYLTEEGEIDEKKEILKEMFPSLEKIESVAGSILFTLFTMEPGAKPLQSTAGMISGYLKTSDSLKDAGRAMWIAMEILIKSNPFAQFSYSKNGYPMISSMITDEEYRTKNIYLPLERPTVEHKELGSFNWKFNREADAIEALDKLNHTALRIKLLQEEEEETPDPSDFSEEGKKQRELKNKQLGRRYLADMYAHKKVYFNWAVDYRARMYSVGYYLNPQGTELEKNMIELWEGEKLTFKGKQRLKKSIASAYGLDKETDLKKLAWFSRNQNMLHLRQKTAKEPYTFQTLVDAWNQQEADPEAEIHTMVELDATNSQAQILAVLTHNRTVALTCNVVPSIDINGEFVVADLYQKIADRMSDIVAEKGNKTTFERKEVKYPLMQAGYGQKEKGTRKQLKEEMGTKYDDRTYDVFVQAVEETVPGFYTIMNFVNNLWNEDWEKVSFTMPDGHVVVIKPTDSVWGEFSLFNELSIKAKVSGVRKTKETLILYVSIIHAIDAYIAREVITRSDFDVLTIHDAFRCHPNNAEDMQKTYTGILAELNEMRLLEDIIEEVIGRKVDTIVGDLKTEDILESKYAIC